MVGHVFARLAQRRLQYLAALETTLATKPEPDARVEMEKGKDRGRPARAGLLMAQASRFSRLEHGKDDTTTPKATLRNKMNAAIQRLEQHADLLLDSSLLPPTPAVYSRIAPSTASVPRHAPIELSPFRPPPATSQRRSSLPFPGAPVDIVGDAAVTLRSATQKIGSLLTEASAHIGMMHAGDPDEVGQQHQHQRHHQRHAPQHRSQSPEPAAHGRSGLPARANPSQRSEAEIAAQLLRAAIDSTSPDGLHRGRRASTTDAAFPTSGSAAWTQQSPQQQQQQYGQLQQPQPQPQQRGQQQPPLASTGWSGTSSVRSGGGGGGGGGPLGRFTAFVDAATQQQQGQGQPGSGAPTHRGGGQGQQDASFSSTLSSLSTRPYPYDDQPPAASSWQQPPAALQQQHQWDPPRSAPPAPSPSGPDLPPGSAQLMAQAAVRLETLRAAVQEADDARAAAEGTQQRQLATIHSHELAAAAEAARGEVDAAWAKKWAARESRYAALVGALRARISDLEAAINAGAAARAPPRMPPVRPADEPLLNARLPLVSEVDGSEAVGAAQGQQQARFLEAQLAASRAEVALLRGAAPASSSSSSNHGGGSDSVPPPQSPPGATLQLASALSTIEALSADLAAAHAQVAELRVANARAAAATAAAERRAASAADAAAADVSAAAAAVAGGRRGAHAELLQARAGEARQRREAEELRATLAEAVGRAEAAEDALRKEREAVLAAVRAAAGAAAGAPASTLAPAGESRAGGGTASPASQWRQGAGTTAAGATSSASAWRAGLLSSSAAASSPSSLSPPMRVDPVDADGLGGGGGRAAAGLDAFTTALSAASRHVTESIADAFAAARASERAAAAADIQRLRSAYEAALASERAAVAEAQAAAASARSAASSASAQLEEAEDTAAAAASQAAATREALLAEVTSLSGRCSEYSRLLEEGRGQVSAVLDELDAARRDAEAGHAAAARLQSRLAAAQAASAAEVAHLSAAMAETQAAAEGLAAQVAALEERLVAQRAEHSAWLAQAEAAARNAGAEEARVAAEVDKRQALQAALARAAAADDARRALLVAATEDRLRQEAETTLAAARAAWEEETERRLTELAAAKDAALIDAVAAGREDEAAAAAQRADAVAAAHERSLAALQARIAALRASALREVDRRRALAARVHELQGNIRVHVRVRPSRAWIAKQGLLPFLPPPEGRTESGTGAGAAAALAASAAALATPARVGSSAAGGASSGAPHHPDSSPFGRSAVEAALLPPTEEDLAAERAAAAEAAVAGPSVQTHGHGQLTVWAAPGTTSGTAQPVSATAAGTAAAVAAAAAAFEYEFDEVLGPRSSQDDVFDAVRPLLDGGLRGLHTCIFAYGQTGSGKTHTMEGSEAAPGVTVRALRYLFAAAGRIATAAAAAAAAPGGRGGAKGGGFSFAVSMMEVHNERVRDLLAGLSPAQLRHAHESQAQAQAAAAAASEDGAGSNSSSEDAVVALRDSHAWFSGGEGEGEGEAAGGWGSSYGSGGEAAGATSGSLWGSLQSLRGFSGEAQVQQAAHGLHAVDPDNLLVREGGGGGASGVDVVGLVRVPVHSAAEALAVVSAGAGRRAVGSHALNEASSRSHMVVRVWVLGPAVPAHPAAASAAHGHSSSSSGFSAPARSTVAACINFVDLAGSERIRRTGVEGERLKEAQAINSSLSCLGNVIAGLKKRAAHVPYRDSKLTFLLKDALAPGGQVLMFACVSGEPEDTQETLATLTFADRCRATALGPATRHVQQAQSQQAHVQALAATGPTPFALQAQQQQQHAALAATSASTSSAATAPSHRPGPIQGVSTIKAGGGSGGAASKRPLSAARRL